MLGLTLSVAQGRNLASGGLQLTRRQAEYEVRWFEATKAPRWS